MNIERTIAIVTSFLLTHKIVALILLAALIIFAYKRPKEAFKFGLFVGLMLVVFYVISQLGESSFKGIQDKSHGVEKSKQLMGD